jgi:glycosyltransferase involved in cell wall biosynthesis
MKILLVNKFLYPRGGDAISTLTTGKLLRDRGHEVVFWGMKHPQNPPYPHEDLFVDHVDLAGGGGIRQQLRTAGNILYSFEARRKIRQLIERERPDIAHLNNYAHQISPSILDALWTARIPTVMTLRDYKLVCPVYSLLRHGIPCDLCTGGRYYQCLRHKCTRNSRAQSLVNTVEMYLHHKLLHIYDKLDLVIATSQFVADKHKAMGLPNEIVRLPNFIDVDAWRADGQPSDGSIVYLGRLTPEKGIGTLVKAVHGLDVPLKIIGEGPMKADLEQLVARGDMRNVSFLGHLDGQALRQEISRAQATIVPSECIEAFGRIIIESFALGIPVVGARIGGIPELVVDGETGYTFEPGNVEDLRAKITTLLADPARRAQFGRAGRERVEREMGPDAHYAQLMQIYEQARAKRAARA